MENDFDNVKNIDSAADISKRKSLRLPITALALDFVPVLIILIGSLMPLLYINFGLIPLLVVILSPFAGITTGIVALSYDRKRIGKLGIILSVVAIALPVIFVLTIILLARTGALIIGM